MVLGGYVRLALLSGRDPITLYLHHGSFQTLVEGGNESGKSPAISSRPWIIVPGDSLFFVLK
jgi:hypothetical protein